MLRQYNHSCSDAVRDAYDSEYKSALLHAVPTRYSPRVWDMWIRDASKNAGEATP